MVTKTNKYKINSILYVTILFLAFFFILLLTFASGHRIKIGIEYYLILFYIITNSFLLFRFPKIMNNKIRRIIGYLLVLFLITNSILVLYFVFNLFLENLISSFDFFLFLITFGFILTSSIIIMEIFKVIKKIK